MTAGRGIIHQEMPEGSAEGKMHGFQIWANLPASHKMMAPRYQDIPARDIPEVIKENGVRIRVLCGEVDGVKGPVRDIVIDPEFLDITVPPHIDFIHPVKQDYTAFFYCIDGNGFTGTQNEIPFHNTMLILFEDGAQVVISTKDEPARVLFISGKPLREPIALGGPIVMNTREELQQAFRDYESGTFK
jgi:hypothetical protein